MDVITLYSTGCPKCNILRVKLDQKKINYKLVEDEQAIKDLGYTEAPILRVGPNYMTFSDAVRWVNSK